MRAQPPRVDTSLPPRERALRGSKRKTKENQTFPAARGCRGSCAQPHRSCAFVHCVGGRGARPSHDLSEINSSPMLGVFFFFLAPWDIKLGLFASLAYLSLLPFG